MARRRGLATRDVVEAAARLADRDGLEHLTLRAVADQLGVRSPSLYTHVDGIDGLRRLLTMRGAEELSLVLLEASAGKPGDEALRSFARTARRFAHRHPGLYDASQRAVRHGDDDEAYRALAEPVGVVAAVLAAEGHAAGDVIPLIRSLRAAVHGFVLLERSGGFGMPEDVERSFETLVDVLVAGICSRVR